MLLWFRVATLVSTNHVMVASRNLMVSINHVMVASRNLMVSSSNLMVASSNLMVASSNLMVASSNLVNSCFVIRLNQLILMYLIIISKYLMCIYPS
ncbi:hypothetical protein HanPSC8_Chr01g0000601 [Helianthus annuus]|nr:hypothetical protein HanPSC8_Chr01g0000601 [Helianthus annuus]